MGAEQPIETNLPASVPVNIYFDEDANPRIADAVQHRGWTVLTTAQAGRYGAPDIDQIQFAAAGGFAFLG